MSSTIKLDTTNINNTLTKEMSNLSLSPKNFDQVIKEIDGVIYKTYPGEHIITQIIDLMQEELSEPYPIFTYRYFLNDYPDSCLMAYHEGKFIGCVIGKCGLTKKGKMKGYIAMIAVSKAFRGKKIGKHLGELFNYQMKNAYNAHEVYLETEVTNLLALSLYEGLGYVRTKRLFNYYLNGNSAFRLKLWLRDFEPVINSQEIPSDK
jgi:peptide alpha-N-acetyltransferase